MTLLNKLKKLEKEGLITLREDDSGELFIANYRPCVQYDNLWTPLLKQCRGLVIDKEGRKIINSFPKFWNLSEHKLEEIPNESVKIFEKLDGSWIGIYRNRKNNSLSCTTRGSFSSDQAILATILLNNKYKNYLNKFNLDNYTYMFEFIGPSDKTGNFLVINYSEVKLVLLAIRDTITGRYQDISSFCWPDKVKKYDGIKDYNSLVGIERENKEGYVIRFKSGFMIKIKHADYIRLHRIITGVSNKSIWEYLKTGQSFDDILDRVPDEFMSFVKKTKEDLEGKYDYIWNSVVWNYQENIDRFKNKSRKDFAEWAKTQNYTSLLFMMLDDISLNDHIWKIIKPDYEKPFIGEIEK